MERIEFDESQLGDLQAIAEQLFANPEDPRSPGYRRALLRPRVRWLGIAASCLFPAAAVGGLWALLTRLGLSPLPALCCCLLPLTLYILARGRSILICLIQIYQRYAPESIRNKCRFEPSCSQYMILALEKYGLRKGLEKGIRRLKRCDIHHGGFDPL